MSTLKPLVLKLLYKHQSKLLNYKTRQNSVSFDLKTYIFYVDIKTFFDN